MTRTRERYAEIRGRLDAGESLSAISRATGLDRKTVQRFARAGSAGELLGKATSRESKLDEFTPYLHQRWNEGVTDAAALHAELQQRGWAGSEQTVRRYVRPFRQAPAAPGPAPAVPKTRQITRWLLTRPDRLQAGEQAQLEAIRARCPHIDALAGHITAFAEMMTARTGSRDLEDWLAAVEADDRSGLRSLAAGIRNDQQAVTNGLSLHWNSGRVEGTVNKIKMIKRQMYGRAGFDLGVGGLEQRGVAEREQPALAAEGPDPGDLVVAVGEEGVQLGLGKRALPGVGFMVLGVHRDVPLVHDLDRVGPEPLLAGRRPLVKGIGDEVAESVHRLGVGADGRALQVTQRAQVPQPLIHHRRSPVPWVGVHVGGERPDRVLPALHRRAGQVPRQLLVREPGQHRHEDLFLGPQQRDPVGQVQPCRPWRRPVQSHRPATLRHPHPMR